MTSTPQSWQLAAKSRGAAADDADPVVAPAADDAADDAAADPVGSRRGERLQGAKKEPSQNCKTPNINTNWTH
jgi:hypothetical protein